MRLLTANLAAAVLIVASLSPCNPEKKLGLFFFFFFIREFADGAASYRAASHESEV